MDCPATWPTTDGTSDVCLSNPECQCRIYLYNGLIAQASRFLAGKTLPTQNDAENAFQELVGSRGTDPPTLIGMTAHRAFRLPNNPYQFINISKPTIISLPIPPEIENM
ncbi:hypothetical protein KIN20_029919 [Parelaphostrongylus tenuis]|uniref:Uncharacterized protein n=1 Tax=Parelaphostrongylus tenuis TaxID=148309 RepID=A0AAD5R3D4_PARTN|nr:hypothetical protein KIN20_029919 [Parelaphostrongylus tenuis]